jgi:hypothetical protein
MLPTFRRTLLALIAAVAALASTSSAETINVPCNAAALSTALTTVATNGKEDFLWLAPFCTYALPTTWSVGSDLGNALWIYGRGATLSGQQQRAVMVVNAGAVLHLIDVNVRNGKSDSNAGAIRNLGHLTLTDTTVSDSTAPGAGGAVQNIGTLRLVRSRIQNATASSEGGAIDNTGRLTLVDSTITGSTALYGGGIRNGGRAALFGSTLAGNGGFLGGGLLNEAGGTAVLGNVTIAHNDVSGSGGGAGIRNEGTLAIDNAIVSDGNPGGGDCSNLGTITATGGNLVEDGSCALAGALTGDPLLGDLTGKPATFALKAGSPAIDAGSNASCPGADQRGMPRPVDGDSNGTIACDLGAAEQPPKRVCGLLGIEGFALLPFIRILAARRRLATREAGSC